MKSIVDLSIRTKIKKSEILDSVTVSVIPLTKTNLMFELKSLRRLIVGLSIGGIKTINRVLVSKSKEDVKKHVLFAEGTGLREVLRVNGVDTGKTVSNHIVEI